MRMAIGREVLASHEKRRLVNIIYVYSEPRQGRLLVLTTLLLYVLPCTCSGPPLLSFADIGKSLAPGMGTYCPPFTERKGGIVWEHLALRVKEGKPNTKQVLGKAGRDSYNFTLLL